MPTRADSHAQPKAYFSGVEEPAFVEEEKRLLKSAHRKRGGIAGADAPWTGICLSGGGIRSATFSLGVLQALAGLGLLKRFDYISSVSGGSYIAASLQWWWSEARLAEDARIPRFGVLRKNFPYGLGKLQSTGGTGPKGNAGDIARPATATTAAASGPRSAAASPDKGETCAPTADSKEQTLMLEFLRSHANYVAPDEGVGVWSGVAVVLRTVLISLLTWLPLLILFFLAVDVLNDRLLNPFAGWIAGRLGFDINRLPVPFGDIPNNWVGSPNCGSPGQPACAFALRLVYAIPIWAFAVSAATFIVLSLIFGLLSRSPQDVSGPPKLSLKVAFTFVAAIALLGGTVYWAIRDSARMLDSEFITLIASLIGATLLIRFASEVLRNRSLNASYFLRRVLERYFQRTFVLSLVVFIIGLTPYLPFYLAHLAKKNDSSTLTLSVTGISVGAVSLISGVASSLYAYYTLVKKWIPGFAARIFVPAGAGFYLYGMFVLAYILAAFPLEALSGADSTLIKSIVPDNHDVGPVRFAIQAASLFAIFVALILALTANVNFVGLHRFYRDRLMETFMPSWAAVVRCRADYSPVADRLLLPDLAEALIDSPGPHPAPYPLINAIAILTNDTDRKTVSRGGTNFVLSPLFVGSSSTGWESTDSHVDRFGPLSLASAMAASGAAINANAGYIGTGVTRDRMVSAAMTFLNMRLGIWVGNPHNRRRRFWTSVPTFFRPMLNVALFDAGHHRSSKFLELADGGNFENLGLYELIRRKLDLIVVVDGEEDPALALPALVSAIERVADDFEAKISFISQRGPERFVLGAVGLDYPTGIRFAQSPFLVGEVSYRDGTKGVLIYIKATMIRGLQFTTSGYWANNPTFPHQTTIDQFFTPEQFEAYRDLGFCSTTVMSEALKLTETFSDPDALCSNYRA